jgi:2-oxoglutarate/2-oxoacid ferredoxin oxidoreductase subunit beta
METKVETAWCPGCGNFAIRDALEKALGELPIPANRIVLASGIGQAAKMPHYLEVNYFNGLHGRSIPLATGIKLARPDLTVIAYSGDGCQYGEGGNHFIHAIRRRLDLTILVSDNQVYALTKGQSSPTTDPGVVNDLAPGGSLNTPLNPLALAITMGAPFVARGFAGDKEHLKELIKQAILFPGTALLDILQPCVSFNKVNTFTWYRERVFKLEAPLTDRCEALKTAELWGERIPIGVIYRDDAAVCREIKEIFRREAPPDQVACQADMTCVMMR